MTNQQQENSDSASVEHASPLPLKGEKFGFNKWTLCVMVLILAYIFVQGLIHHKNNATQPKEADETYVASSPITQEQKDKSIINDSLNKEHQIEQQIAAAKAKDFIDRLQVPQNMGTDGTTNNIQATTANLLTQSQDKSNLIQAPDDPNTAFLLQASETKTEHSYATYLKPLPYLVGQGKFIFGTLAVAIDSDLPGQIEAVVNQDIYGEQGRKILIPRGSHLTGEYRSGLSNNQSRLFTVWTRIKEPNGIDISLGSEGTDSLGRAGVTGQVDYHFIDRFGSAIL